MISRDISKDMTNKVTSKDMTNKGISKDMTNRDISSRNIRDMITTSKIIRTKRIRMEEVMMAITNKLILEKEEETKLGMDFNSKISTSSKEKGNIILTTLR